MECCFEDRIDHTMTEPPMKPLLKVDIFNCSWLKSSVYVSSARQDLSHPRSEDNKSEERKIYHLMQIRTNQLRDSWLWHHSPSNRRPPGKGMFIILKLILLALSIWLMCPWYFVKLQYCSDNLRWLSCLTIYVAIFCSFMTQYFLKIPYNFPHNKVLFASETRGGLQMGRGPLEEKHVRDEVSHLIG